MEKLSDFRSITLDGLRQIGSGGRADVYVLDGNKAVKVFHDELGREQIETELRQANVFYDNGLPAVRAYEAVTVGDRYGILFDYIKGPSLGNFLSGDPEKLPVYAEEMGMLLKKVHNTSVRRGTLPDIKERSAVLTDYLEEHFIPAEDAGRIRDILRIIPDSGTLLHCDFHPGNLIVREEPDPLKDFSAGGLQDRRPDGSSVSGKLVLIDLDDVCTGHPVFDLTFNALLHKYSTASMIRQAMDMTPELAGRTREIMLRTYFGTADQEALSEYGQGIDAFGTVLLPLIMARSVIAWSVTEEQAKVVIRECTQKLKENYDELVRRMRKIVRFRGEEGSLWKGTT